MKKKINLIYLFCLLSTFSLFANTIDQSILATSKNAIENLTNTIKASPQEVIYLKTDKPFYSASDMIWIRAFKVHSALHIPFMFSRYIYIELVNSENTLITRKKIRPIDNMYYGQIKIIDGIKPGWYYLRAYTNYMRNQSDTYFFKKKIYIGNAIKDKEEIKHAEARLSAVKQEKRVNKLTKPFYVGIYPEGGNLIEGNLQTVAIRTITKDSLPIATNGFLTDYKDSIISKVKSDEDGLGLFSINLSKNTTYKLKLTDSIGNKIEQQLPSISNDKYSLYVQETKNLAKITILTPNHQATKDTLLIMATQGGVPIYNYPIEPGKNSLTISKKGLKSGILNFNLINRKNQVLSSRAIFIDSNDFAKVNISTNKNIYRTKDRVMLHTSITSSKGTPLSNCNFAIAVTEDENIPLDSAAQDLKSYLLIESDLDFPINNSGKYLNKSNSSLKKRNILMMILNWKRYNIPAIINNTYEIKNKYEVEKGPVITGKVQSFPSHRGLANHSVNMFAQKGLHFDAVQTNQKGKFIFEGFELPDSTSIYLEAKGKLNGFIDLIVDKDDFPKINQYQHFPKIYTPTKKMEEYFDKMNRKYVYENGMYYYDLSQVTVVGNKTDKQKKLRRERGALYSYASTTFDSTDISRANSILYLLLMAPGVQLNSSGTGITIRGGEPMVIVDDIQYTMDELNNLIPEDVEMIDVLKEASQTSLYGSQASYGIIYVYLKHGKKNIDEKERGPNQTVITPLGYEVPAEFFMPKYPTEESRHSGDNDMRTTIYWRPNIVCNKQGESDITFYTSQAKGTYTIFIEGITNKGEIISKKQKILIK